MDDDCDSSLVEQKLENENDKENDECGLCSPFISCGSCIGFISISEKSLVPFNFQPLALSNLFGLSFKGLETEYSERVWQPPKQVIIS